MQKHPTPKHFLAHRKCITISLNDIDKVFCTTIDGSLTISSFSSLKPPYVSMAYLSDPNYRTDMGKEPS